MKRRSLANVRVAVLAADGVEQIEMSSPLKALRRAGADPRILSLRPGRIRSVNLIWRGRKFPVDDTVFGADPSQYAALFLPGGFVNPDLLRQSDAVRRFVQAFDRAGKPIAVICHGAETLISAGLVRGRRLTTWPGIADDVRNAGGSWHDEPLVRDGNWVSSRGPQDLVPFNEGMIALFEALATRRLPAPPRRLRWVASLLRVGTLAALGGLAFGVRRRLKAAT